MPTDWYVLERAVGGGGRHLRVGLYCSLTCLAAAGSEMATAERDAGTRPGQPARGARGRARLVEIAQTLLHQGATIRQAGDDLGVPTATLRHWLREAGVRVGADGTLTGSGGPAAAPTADKQQGSGATGALSGPAQAAAADRPARSAPMSSAGPAPTTTAPSPTGTLNELAQAGYVSDLSWEIDVTGSAHPPAFSCAITVQVAGIAGQLRAQGVGGSKAAAKTAAAAALLAGLADDDPVAALGAATGRQSSSM